MARPKQHACDLEAVCCRRCRLSHRHALGDECVSKNNEADADLLTKAGDIRLCIANNVAKRYRTIQTTAITAVPDKI